MAKVMPLPPKLWLRIEPIINAEQRDGRGRSVESMNKIVSAIIWVHQYNMPWTSIPSDFAPSSTCNTKYRAWKANGIWDKILFQIAAFLKEEYAINIKRVFYWRKFDRSKMNLDFIREKSLYCTDMEAARLLAIFLYKSSADDQSQTKHAA
jgi:transposase